VTRGGAVEKTNAIRPPRGHFREETGSMDSKDRGRVTCRIKIMQERQDRLPRRAGNPLQKDAKQHRDAGKVAAGKKNNRDDGGVFGAGRKHKPRTPKMRGGGHKKSKKAVEDANGQR